MERTILLLQLGDLDRARAVMEEALQQSPDEPWINIYYARLAEMADAETESAIHRLQGALDQDPTILEGHLFLAEAQETSEEFQAAANTLRAALERWPNDLELHSRLGLLSIRLRDADAAEAPPEPRAEPDRGAQAGHPGRPRLRTVAKERCSATHGRSAEPGSSAGRRFTCRPDASTKRRPSSMVYSRPSLAIRTPCP